MDNATSTTALPRLLTAREVSDAIGISEHRLYELARQSRIPSVRIGRSVRFDPRRVADWLRAGGESETSG